MTKNGDMTNWKNRDRKLKKRKSFNKQNKVGRKDTHSTSDKSKREIKQQQRNHRKNTWHDEAIEEDEVSW